MEPLSGVGNKRGQKKKKEEKEEERDGEGASSHFKGLLSERRQRRVRGGVKGKKNRYIC